MEKELIGNFSREGYGDKSIDLMGILWRENTMIEEDGDGVKSARTVTCPDGPKHSISVPS